MFTINILCYFC